jgi:kynurenine formamidase
MNLVDLSHPIEDGMATYPGLPGPTISQYLSFDASHERYSPGTEFSIGEIKMVANTGTYLDTPAHRYRGAADLAGLALADCANLAATVVDADGAISSEVLAGHEIAGRAVLFRTGFDRHWRTERYGAGGHPFCTAAAATSLVDRGARLVGIDSVNIDDTATGARAAHTILLGAGIPIVEHLRGLEALPATGARFFAVPPMIRGLATFSVRAFAIVP